MGFSFSRGGERISAISLLWISHAHLLLHLCPFKAFWFIVQKLGWPLQRLILHPPAANILYST